MRYGWIKVAAYTHRVVLASPKDNARLLAEGICEMAKQGVKFVVTPELGLTGYTCGDLFLQEALLQGSLDGLAEILCQTATCDTVAAVGLPAGWGDPMFGGVEGRMAAALFGIPAVKGVEFGAGFGVARMRGSENNDPFAVENGEITTKSNHAGGILGGITTGMPLVFRMAFKPTPSIAREQDSVSLSRGEDEKLSIVGRHDPCIVPRAVPVAEAAAAVVLLDLLLDSPALLAGKR